MIRKTAFIIVAGLILLAPLCACSPGKQKETPRPVNASDNAEQSLAPDKVVITFEYKKQSGMASNQFAVWIEDMDDRLIKTLYATRFTANGGYKSRPESIALWVERSGLASMSQAGIDAITGATPASGTLSYTWDLTDTNGNAVLPGEYRFFVEGTLRWANSLLYSGVITVGDAPSTVIAGQELMHKALSDLEHQGALTGNAAENSMISSVTAIFIPNTAN
ncbi:MAG: DUF2271 domain-containing protein [Clostridiales bacterium]|nr:DUF2271 domain-containing protein [Clostridiales bacterium]